jgi:hypothetical protein
MKITFTAEEVRGILRERLFNVPPGRCVSEDASQVKAESSVRFVKREEKETSVCDVEVEFDRAEIEV